MSCAGSGHLRWVFCFLLPFPHFFLYFLGACTPWAGSIHWSFLMSRNIKRPRPRWNEFSKFVFVVREWQVVPEIYAHSKEIKQPKRERAEWEGQWLMCITGARVTFNSNRMDDRWPALIIRCSRCPGHVQSPACNICAKLGKEQEGDLGPLLRARGSQFSPQSPAHHTVLGDKQENRFSHSGQFTSGASLSGAICQSLSLQAGREERGTADKVGCQAALITDHAVRERLKSCSAPRTAPAWQR